MADEPVTAYRRRWGERLAVWARRHRAWVLAGTAALILVTVVSIAASLGMDSARRQRDRIRPGGGRRAGSERSSPSKQALDALHQAKKSTAMLTLDTGLRLCEQGKVSHGILCLARSLRELPDGEADLQHVIRSNLAAWGRETHRLRFSVQHEGSVDIDANRLQPRMGEAFMTAGRDVVGASR